MGEAWDTYEEIRNSYPVVAAKSRKGRECARSTSRRENSILCLSGDPFSCSYYPCEAEFSLQCYRIMKWKWFWWTHILIHKTMSGKCPQKLRYLSSISIAGLLVKIWNKIFRILIRIASQSTMIFGRWKGEKYTYKYLGVKFWEDLTAYFPFTTYWVLDTKRNE